MGLKKNSCADCGKLVTNRAVRCFDCNCAFMRKPVECRNCGGKRKRDNVSGLCRECWLDENFSSDPTPEEIEREAALIRAEWDERDWNRQPYQPGPCEVHRCRVDGLKLQGYVGG